jgi:hypothetical protein
MDPEERTYHVRYTRVLKTTTDASGNTFTRLERIPQILTTAALQGKTYSLLELSPGRAFITVSATSEEWAAVEEEMTSNNTPLRRVPIETISNVVTNMQTQLSGGKMTLGGGGSKGVRL